VSEFLGHSISIKASLISSLVFNLETHKTLPYPIELGLTAICIAYLRGESQNIYPLWRSGWLAETGDNALTRGGREVQQPTGDAEKFRPIFSQCRNVSAWDNAG
jgi:hypothetical protein